MSYLVGGGDAYKSHTFATLKWTEFARIVQRHFAEPSQEAGPDLNADDPEFVPLEVEHDADERVGDSVTVQITNTGISKTSSYVDDYLHRPLDPAFANLSLYDHVRLTRKASVGKEDRQRSVQEDETRGRRRNTKAHFTRDHPQHGKQMLVRRTKEVVPVLLGPSIPNRHNGAAAEEHWCRTMMILFKPWRLPSGLKLPTQSWAKAFSLEEFTPDLHAFMTNTTILAECRDARDAQRASRANKGPVAWNVTHDAPPASADELLTNLILDEARDVVSAQVDDSDAHVDGDEPQASLAEQVFGPSFVLSSSQGGVSDAI